MTIKLNHKIVGLLISVIYLVGIIGLINDTWRPTFISLTVLNLLITFFVAIAFQKKSSQFFIWLTIVCISGYLIEVIGVQTGLIFGDYQYLNGLGFKILETPLMIGINWGLLCLLSCNLWTQLKLNDTIKALLSSVSLVVLDLLIEPVCTFLGLWKWDHSIAPIQNYLAWGGIAFIFSMLFFKLVKNSTNKIALLLFILQIAFFLSINLFR